MPSKTISLEDGAYELLRGAKREGESFSMVVRRLLEPRHRDPLSRMAGLLSGEKGEAFARVIADKRAEERGLAADRRRRLGLP